MKSYKINITDNIIVKIMNNCRSISLKSLIALNIERNKNLFLEVSELVNQLHKVKILLEKNQSKEALLMIEQLVPYSESLARKF